MVNIVGRINEVKQHRVQVVLGWVTYREINTLHKSSYIFSHTLDFRNENITLQILIS